VRSFYGDQTYARLLAVKDRWDPHNAFRHDQNIRPSAGA
jgi:FAD/FMN-containing dehydrogenase